MVCPGVSWGEREQGHTGAKTGKEWLYSRAGGSGEVLLQREGGDGGQCIWKVISLEMNCKGPSVPVLGPALCCPIGLCYYIVIK